MWVYLNGKPSKTGTTEHFSGRSCKTVSDAEMLGSRKRLIPGDPHCSAFLGPCQEQFSSCFSTVLRLLRERRSLFRWVAGRWLLSRGLRTRCGYETQAWAARPWAPTHPRKDWTRCPCTKTRATAWPSGQRVTRCPFHRAHGGVGGAGAATSSPSACSAT